MGDMDVVQGACVLAVLVMVAVVDARERIIPNRLVAVVAAFPVVRIVVVAASGGDPLGLLAQSAYGVLAVAVVLAAAWLAWRCLGREQGLGGGDVKLLLALGACVGSVRTLLVAGLACVLALGLCLASWVRGRPLESFPFGPFLAASWGVVFLAEWAGMVGM